MNILLVDDHELFRQGLCLLLDNHPDARIVAQAGTGIEMLDYLADHRDQVDVVLLDISMPDMDGVQAAELALQRYEDLKIITLSMFGEEDYYFKMVGLGVKGFLLKSSGINEVVEAIGSVYGGGSYFSHELLTNLVSSLRSSSVARDDASHNDVGSEEALSARELEIVLLICKGLTNVEIADQLCISKRTVDKHRANILEKTACRNTANLVVYAIKNNLVEI